jgi:methionine--tRNA ligase beta chain
VLSANILDSNPSEIGSTPIRVATKKKIMKELITINTLASIDAQLELKLGTIISIDKVEKSTKMLKLSVSFGENDVRTVMTSIGDKVNTEELLNSVFPFVTNLTPAKVMGVMSEAMIVVPSIGGVINLTGEPGSDLKLL